jgi:long-subunit acyl-CoA synthetase (AMP-forming)
MVVAGAPPPTKTIERIETDLGWEFVQIYGLTETSPLLTMNRTRAEWDHLSPADRAAKIGAAGAPSLGVEMKVDAEGEVLARGNVVMSGYWEQPEETSKAIVDGWFHTGDGGSEGENHHITIADRKKDVIISGGENVSSIEVEDAVFSHADVAEVAAAVADAAAEVADVAAAVADTAALAALVAAAVAEPRIEFTYSKVVASPVVVGVPSPVILNPPAARFEPNVAVCNVELVTVDVVTVPDVIVAPEMVPPVTVAVLVIVPDKVAPAMIGVVNVLFVSVCVAVVPVITPSDVVRPCSV